MISVISNFVYQVRIDIFYPNTSNSYKTPRQRMLFTQPIRRSGGGGCGGVTVTLSPGYTRDWLPAQSFVLRARAMVLTGQRTLSDTSRARQQCPRARQRAADNYVYRLSRALKNRLQRAHQGTDSDAKLRHSPGMPAADHQTLIYSQGSMKEFNGMFTQIFVQGVEFSF